MSDTPETMGGLSGRTNCTSLIDNIKPREPKPTPASAIENRADAASDSGFARLCFIAGVQTSAAQKVLQNCLRDADMTRGVLPNLERHGSSKMQISGRLENATFFEPNFRLHFHLKILKCVSYNITYHPNKGYAYCGTRKTRQFRSDAASARTFPDEPEDGTGC